MIFPRNQHWYRARPPRGPRNCQILSWHECISRRRWRNDLSRTSFPPARRSRAGKPREEESEYTLNGTVNCLETAALFTESVSLPLYMDQATSADSESSAISSPSLRERIEIVKREDIETHVHLDPYRFSRTRARDGERYSRRAAHGEEERPMASPGTKSPSNEPDVRFPTWPGPEFLEMEAENCFSLCKSTRRERDPINDLNTWRTSLVRPCRSD